MFNDFCDFQKIWVFLFLHCLVHKVGQNWCKEGCQISNNNWFNFLYIASFIYVDSFHDFCHFLNVEGGTLGRVSCVWVPR